MISIPSPLAIRFAQAHAKSKELSDIQPEQRYDDWNREFHQAVSDKCQAVDAIGDWLMGERFHEWEGEP